MSRIFVALSLIAVTLSRRDDSTTAAAAAEVVGFGSSSPFQEENEKGISAKDHDMDIDAGQTIRAEDEIDNVVGIDNHHHPSLAKKSNDVKSNGQYFDFPRIVVDRFSRAMASEISRRFHLNLQRNFPPNLPWPWKIASKYHEPWQQQRQQQQEEKETMSVQEGEDDSEGQKASSAADETRWNQQYKHYPPRERWVGAWCPPELLDESKINAGEDDDVVVVVDKSLTIPYHSLPPEASSNESFEHAVLDENIQPGMVVFVFPPREQDSGDGGAVGVGSEGREEVVSSNKREGSIASLLEASLGNDVFYKDMTKVMVKRDEEEADGEEGSHLMISAGTKCLQDMGQLYDHDSRVVQYALIQREPFELGIADVHRRDFAYQPVALMISQDKWSSSAKVDDTTTCRGSSRSSSSRELETANKQSYWYGFGGGSSERDDHQVSFRWFSWVTHISQLLHSGSGGYTKATVDPDGSNGLIGSNSDLNRQTTAAYQSNIYEENGKRPFAGGSHGEIWRARRRCPIILGSKDDSRFNDSVHENPSSCDSDRDLIVKRLKIEFGYPVLEAGLREIYFGELLSREVESSGLFTSYVDHFFREGKRGQVELWIVFENAGSSLRSFLYTPVDAGGYMIFQHSAFWRKLRSGMASGTRQDDESLVIFHPNHSGYAERAAPIGKELFREVLKQLISSVDFLHKRGIVHRDIKPSNIMCKTTPSTTDDSIPIKIEAVRCLLGDFSSAWDEFSSRNLYANGPSLKEQTNEYAPPEVLFQGLSTWIPFCLERPTSYDAWSVGVVALELLLGTPNIFSVDQRTTALLTNRLTKEGATSLDIQRALYLAALSQFCIYVPTVDGMNWPLRRGDPLYDVNVVKEKCTLKDFHNALRARDPLGVGFDDDANNLLHLVWRLLAWDPLERLSVAEALRHPYFTTQSYQRVTYSSTVIVPDFQNALEHQTLDPRLDMSSEAAVTEFICPTCGRKFSDHNSCQHHARSRRHAQFCTYDRGLLPPCLNAHSMLPTHPTSGYCDIQGRRKTIEDFHTVHLNPFHEFYGIFDGHLGNLASKYASSSFHDQIEHFLSDLDSRIRNSQSTWREDVTSKITQSFEDLHHGIINAVKSSPGGIMDESGTTATILLVTELAVIIANVGDSRAVMSHWSIDAKENTLITAMQLTVDHVASSDEEKIQILERGGFVSESGGIDRVMGSLAVSRSLGDIKLASVLSRTPHVLTLTKEEVFLHCGNRQRTSMPCFIVLASDGLWDVLDNQEAVELVWQVIQGNNNDGTAYQDAAEMLAQEAYVRGSSDNIGVCVVAIMENIME